MKTFSISIPKPCHEDWNKMTPDEKGAFCASCQKSVYDFSNKTDEQIIEVFEKEEKGKVCGRFTTEQLSRPVISFEGNYTSTMKRLAYFAYTLLLVFGASLFSGSSAYGQELVKGKTKLMGKPSVEQMKMGEPAVTPKVVRTCGLRAATDLRPLGQATIVEEPIKITGDTMISAIDIINETEVEHMVKGEIEYIEPVIIPVDTPIVVDTPEILMVAGGVRYVEVTELLPQIVEPVDSAVDEPVNIIDVIEDPRQIIEDPIQVFEDDPIVVEDDPQVIDDDNNERTGLVNEDVIVPIPDLKVFVSPNPTRGEITLSYTLESAMPVRIDLYDGNGKFLRNLTDLPNQYPGKYNAYYNLSDLRNGTYSAVLITSDRRVTAKILLTK